MKRIEIDGQISLFDLEIFESNEKTFENPILNLKIKEIKKISSNEEIINKYKTIKNLNRIIAYCGGGFGIETLEENTYKTLYVNQEGKEEFIIKSRCPVLPMDRILFNKDEINYTEIQLKKLSEYKNSYKKIIQRKGDENIILKKEGQVISINPKGWILEFKEHEIIYQENEVLKKENKKDFKTGDKVVILYENKKLNGEIRSKHELYSAYSIDFINKGKMCNTTFHISQIIA